MARRPEKLFCLLNCHKSHLHFVAEPYKEQQPTVVQFGEKTSRLASDSQRRATRRSSITFSGPGARFASTGFEWLLIG